MPSSKAYSASTLRGVIRAYARPFTLRRIYIDLGMAPGPERRHVRRVLRDFEQRGEVYRTNEKYVYITSFRLNARNGPLRQRIFKAMYVSNKFTVCDIALLSHGDRNYINKSIRGLIAAGYLARTGKVQGNEWQYRIVNRDKFHVEIM